MPKCYICDADMPEHSNDPCTTCTGIIEETLDDYDVEQNEGIHIAGIVQPLEQIPALEEDDT